MTGKSHSSIPEGESPFESFPAPPNMVHEYTKKYSQTGEVKGSPVLKLILKTIMLTIQKLSWESAYKLGAGIGKLLYLFKVRKFVAMTNLDIAFGDEKTPEEKEKIYRESLITFGRLMVNYFKLPFQDEKFWRENCSHTNEEVYIKATNRKQGVLVLAGHIGTWDLAAGKVGMHGYPVAVIAKQIGNPVVNKVVIDARISMNVGSIGTKNAMTRIFAGLTQGETVAMALDQNIGQKRGVFINWFGTPASSVKSAAYVSRETRVPVIAAIMIQHGPKEFELIMSDEIPWVDHPEDPEKEMVINTQKMSDVIEAIVREMPEQWFWIHKRWKHQPPGMPDLYKKKQKG